MDNSIREQLHEAATILRAVEQRKTLEWLELRDLEEVTSKESTALLVLMEQRSVARVLPTGPGSP